MNTKNLHNQRRLAGSAALLALFLFLSMTAKGQVWQIGSPNAANVTATFKNDTLTISGSGNMMSFRQVDATVGTTNAPWDSLRNSIKSLAIQSGITRIGSYAFYNCSHITGNLTIPDSVMSIGNYAFNGCTGFTGNLTIPNSVTSIGNYAFNGCTGFTGNLIIPGFIATIGDYAFNGCIGSTRDLTIPNSVSSIGAGAFGNCSGLTSVTCRNTAPSGITLGANVFAGVNTAGCVLYIPIGSKPFYEAAAQWSDFTNKVETFPTAWQIGSPNVADVTATLKNDTLIISGKGAMQNFNSGAGIGITDAPWYSLINSIKHIDIQSGITGIGDYAFYYHYNITGNLIIPASVTSIGNYAFYGCGGFTGDLTLPDSVKSIGNYAFCLCSGLKGNLIIPNSVTSISEGAFNQCGFTGDLIIPNSVTSIGEGAFYSCKGLTSLTIPNSVTSIGNYAFTLCSNITSVTCYNLNPNTINFGINPFGVMGYNCVLNVPIGSKVLYQADYYDFGNFGTIVESVPAVWQIGAPNAADVTATLDPNGTMTISGTGAMRDFTNLYSSTITTPWYSLRSSITATVINEGITHIGDYAFYYHNNITGNLTIPNSVTSIGNFAFDGCNGFTGDLIIPDSVTSIGNYAFRNCSGITGDLIIPNSVTSIGNFAFLSCTGFTGNLTIPNSVTSIGGSAFYGCSGLTGDLIIPDSITLIGRSAFDGCSGLTGDIIIPNSITSIYMNTFDGCSGLTSLTIPNSVTSIDVNAFRGCSGLTSVTCLNPTPSGITLGGGVFAGVNTTDCVLNIPTGSKALYEAAPQWQDFLHKEELPWQIGSPNAADVTATLDPDGTLTVRGKGAMRNFTSGDAPWYDLRAGISSLVIQQGVTNIGNWAFYNCGNLKGALIIPASVTSVGANAFWQCSGLTGDLTIPNAVTGIGDYAFADCSGLTGLTIPTSVKSIDAYAFKNCSGLTSVTNLNPSPSAITLGTNIFSGVSKTSCVLTVPAGSKTLYAGAPQWQDFFNNIVELGIVPTITTTSLPGGTVGAAYAQTLQATGDLPIAWSVSAGSLPNGLSLDGTTGAISGTPTANGTFNFTVKATNSKGSDSKALSVVIDAAPAPTYAISASTPATFGSLQTPYIQPAAQTVTVTNTGTGSVTLKQPAAAYYFVGTLSQVTLAPGAKATFTVQPKANLVAGNYGETITVSGSDGASATVYLSFTVTPAAVYTYAISATMPATFGILQAPYTQPAAQTVIITNTGTGSVTLNQPIAAYYLIGTLSQTVLAPGGKATFTVQPKANLVAGNYGETITVSGNDGASATIFANFTVNVSTGIDNVGGETGLKARVENGTLYVEGLTADEKWSVYTLTGTLAHQGVANGNVRLAQHGVYIVRSGNQTVKIVY